MTTENPTGKCPQCNCLISDAALAECPSCGFVLVDNKNPGLDDTIDFDHESHWAKTEGQIDKTLSGEGDHTVDFDTELGNADDDSDIEHEPIDPALNIGAPDEGPSKPVDSGDDPNAQTIDFIAAKNPLLARNSAPESENDGDATVEMEDPNATIDFRAGDATIDVDTVDLDSEVGNAPPADDSDDILSLDDSASDNKDPNATVDFRAGDATVDIDTVDLESDTGDATPGDNSGDTLSLDDSAPDNDDPNGTVDFTSGDVTVDSTAEELTGADTFEIDASGSDDEDFELTSDVGTVIDDSLPENSDPNATVDQVVGELTIDESPLADVGQDDNSDEQSTIAAEDLDFDLDDNSMPLETVNLDSADDQANGTATDSEQTIASDMATVDLPTQPPPTGQDDVATVMLPEGAVAPTDLTLELDSVDTEQNTANTENLGTEGRLKRLWHGVAGSGENPMHSLQGIGQQASDTVFERVATRRVADAHVKADKTADYQIVDKLGEGAMGLVFSARQTGVNRIVAFKTAKPSYQKNAESRRRFLYEAHITADLDHSNIVPIYELGASEEGLLFYSMKLVSGTEWSRVIRKKSREENLEIFMKVADAMAFAHSKGVIHRDLKPENTMLGRFGEVFVTDWGTAINIEKDSSTLAIPSTKGDRFITVKDGSGFAALDAIAIHNGKKVVEKLQVKQIDPANPNRFYLRKKLANSYDLSQPIKLVKIMNLAGTPCYMAPEMAGHDLARLGTRSDIYILGAILFDIVTGQAPHIGESVTQCLRAALRNAAIDKETDDPLLKIAFKAMASDPDDRFQTVEELQDALREYRRHAESITLTGRADELFVNAVKDADYEKFSRTMFLYGDAIELWPENEGAQTGLQNSRLAFGQAAFAKSDYDLVLQTLNTDIDVEAELYEKAELEKKRAEGRETALTFMKRAIAAVVLLAVILLSGATWYAFDQKSAAELATGKAQKLADDNFELAKDEAAAKDEAIKAREKAEQQEELAIASAKAEKAAKDKAIASAIAEATAKDEAIQAQENEKTARIAADKAANLAKLRAAKIQLGEYNSTLALAKSQIEAFDLEAGRENLTRLRDLKSDVFLDRNPDFDTWGWKRISLLSNQDLPAFQVQGSVTATAVATDADVAAVGTQDGKIQAMRLDKNGQLVAVAQIVMKGTHIDSLALSPAGESLVYSATLPDGQNSLGQWTIGQPESQAIRSAGNREFQSITFNQDGTRLLAGINGGIWIWECTGDWQNEGSPAQRLPGVRGSLNRVQAIGPTTFLLTANFNGKVLLSLLNAEAGTSKLIDLPTEIEQDVSSVGFLNTDTPILIGLSDNRLYSGLLDTQAGAISALRELENKHGTAITQIVATKKNELITSSRDEPVVHVWQYENQEWRYATHLAATTNNLVGVGVFGSNQIFGVDVTGQSVTWNIARQEQRRKLQRQTGKNDADGSVAYLTPVKGVFAGSSNGEAITVDENGVIDLWNLDDGSTARTDDGRWSYFGHTPGIELVDTAVDVKRGIVITAGKLRNADRAYLAAPDDDWEFCIWDLATGNMQRRWSVPQRQLSTTGRTESIEQRLSLMNNGQDVLFASDQVTRIVSLKTGATTFAREDFGAYFAVSHPVRDSQSILVKRSGAVKILDLAQPSSWDSPDYEKFSLADPSDIPLKGIWNSAGDRFYLAFSSGGLGCFTWDGQRIELVWSSRQLEGDTTNRKLANALKLPGGRLQSHLDLDISLSQTRGEETINIATRMRGLKSNTSLVTIAFPVSNVSIAPRLIDRSTVEGLSWLQSDSQGQPELSSRIHNVFEVDSNQVRGKLNVGTETFVSTRSAQVYRFVDGDPRLSSYGRAKLISVAGTRDGKSVFTLHEDGAIWRFDKDVGESPWSKLPFAALGARQLSVSPDQTKLLVVSSNKATLIDATSGVSKQDFGPISSYAWDHSDEQLLAIVRDGRTLQVFAGDTNRELELTFPLQNNESIKSVQFFTETWSEPASTPRKHVLVQTESDSAGRLQFIPLEQLPPGSEVPDSLGGTAELTPTEIPLGASIAVSPSEGVFLTGAPGGTVTVWFATPTWEANPRQLYDLEGHRGADITCLTFASDGQTAITADDKNRLYAWMSVDTRSGAKGD